MRKLRVIFLLPAIFLFAASRPAAAAQEETKEEPTVLIESLTDNTHVEYNSKTGLATATNGVMVRYGLTVLTADSATVNEKSGDVIADGKVRILQGEMFYAGEHVRYNFLTRKMETEVFRTGKSPVFAAGEKLSGDLMDLTNGVYNAQSTFITTDDFSEPGMMVRAKSITIAPGKYIRARHAVVYLGGVPVLYLPYYSRTLGTRVNNFNFVPGYRTRFGPFLLSTYNWFLNEKVDGALHADYRVDRGAGGGADMNLHLGRWGETTVKYYYLHDTAPGTDVPAGATVPGEDRQRLDFGHNMTPFTNLNVKAVVRYQSDELVLRDFFEGDYRRNPQPSTFVEVNKHWDNFALDLYTQPRVNDFFETVERLPDLRLTGFRQQIGPTPLFYESESSGGFYRRKFSESTNNLAGTNNYFAFRGDTYHQVTLPQTFFGWLNVIPRVGGRFTYYTDDGGPAGTNNQISRGVFNTGAEATFKVSRLWSGATNSFLEVDGLRHIMEPSVNYVFVPAPNHRPPELPQFDSELPSLRLLPIEYPDYNAIDSVDSQNVVRLGLRNRIQTKRDGRIDNLFYSEIFTDWRVGERNGRGNFSDIFSDATFRPRSWLTLESQTRFNVNENNWRMLVHNVTFSPNDRWSWSVGHWFMRDDLSTTPTGLSTGNQILRSTFFFKLNENWALRASHFYDLRAGRMQEQAYTVYRDLRSWTAGFTVRMRDDGTGREDFTAAFTFSLKAVPRYVVGGDAVRPSELLGY